MISRLLRALKTLGSWLLALLILFEEWGWAPLSRLMARIGALPVLRQIERWIKGLPPYAALALLLLPSLLLLPVKLLALWLIGIGRGGLGLVVILVAKLLGTAVVARLFELTHPALMRLAWFARTYTRWLAWKAALLAQVRGSDAWRAGRRAQRLAKRALRRTWRLLFA
nr:hypothetical protein [uncultured Roseateles sp.]